MRLWTDHVGFSGMPLASVSTRVLESRVMNLFFNPCKSHLSDWQHLRSDIEEGAWVFWQLASSATCAPPSDMSAKNPTTRAVNTLHSFLLPKPPPSLDTRAGNLYQVLSQHLGDGIGLKVHQTQRASQDHIGKLQGRAWTWREGMGRHGVYCFGKVSFCLCHGFCLASILWLLAY